MKSFITYLNKQIILFIIGVIGAFLQICVSWEFNSALFTIFSILLLIVAFGRIDKWFSLLPIVFFIILSKIIAIHGGWDLTLLMEIAFGILVSMPLILALYAYRYSAKKLSFYVHLFVFPIVFVMFDYLLTFASLGMVFSFIYTQCKFLLVVNATSLFGSWFVEFVLLWLISYVASIGLRKEFTQKKIIALISCVVISLGFYSQIKQIVTYPRAKTVNIASITVEHTQDYWQITDNFTPNQHVQENKAEMKLMNDELIRLSQKAADFGSKIIFWSEANYVIYEDQYEDFVYNMKIFADTNNVYLMTTPLVLRYGQNKNDNLCIMFSPNGELLFRYEKTYSWYPTESNGIVPVIETPYGKIATVICFDADYPNLLLQAAKKDVDIVLVPGYDTDKISPFHTQVAFLRCAEYGFSMVRHSNEGSSMAADYNGNIISHQDYFTTDERLMISNVPSKGIKTLYGITGEWFVYIVLTAPLVYFAHKLYIFIKRKTLLAKNKSL